MRIAAGWAFVEGELRANVVLDVDARGRLSSVATEPSRTAVDIVWRDKLVLPGFIDALAILSPDRLAHLNAARFGVAAHLQSGSLMEPATLRVMARACFQQALRQGTTTLAWLQPAVASRTSHTVALADAVLEAASECGIRLVFLQALNIHRPSATGLDLPSFEACVEALLSLGQHVALRRNPCLSWGLGAEYLDDMGADEWVALKTRLGHLPFVLPTTAAIPWLARGTPLSARTPIELLLQANLIDSLTAVVDPWAMTEPERVLLRVFGAGVIARGDRLADEGSLRHLLRHRVPMAIGSGEGPSIRALAARLVYGFVHQVSAELQRANLALVLDALTVQGARTTGCGAGRIAPGCWADLAAYALVPGAGHTDVPEATLVAILGAEPPLQPAAVMVGGSLIAGMDSPG